MKSVSSQMQGSSTVKGVSSKADNYYPPCCREVPEGASCHLQNCSCAIVNQSCPTGHEAPGAVWFWVPGKIRPCFNGEGGRSCGYFQASNQTA